MDVCGWVSTQSIDLGFTLRFTRPVRSRRQVVLICSQFLKTTITFLSAQVSTVIKIVFYKTFYYCYIMKHCNIYDKFLTIVQNRIVCYFY